MARAFITKNRLKIIYTLTFLSTWFILHTVIISIDGLTDNIETADCILILGNKVNEDGTLSTRLKSRVDKGLELYRKGFSTKIIVSGGLGKEGHYEGTAMKAYLIDKGLPGENIIVDDAGDNTHKSVLNFMELSKSHQLNSVIVVSQFFHISRTKTMLYNSGNSFTVFSAHAAYYELRDVYALIREFFAFYNYLLIARKM